MSRLLSKNPDLVNWRDYVTGTALHFAAQVNDMSLVRLLAGTFKANVDVRNHGLTPLHMAAIGASEEVAFALMSQFNAKATVRDYSGRLPFSYVPDTEAGTRLRIKKLVLEMPPVPTTLSSQPASPGTPRPPLPTAATSPSSPIPHDRSRSNQNKRTSLLFCSMRKTSKSRRDQRSSPMCSAGLNNDEELVTRDDLPPTSPTQIGGFTSLRKHKARARPMLPQVEASNFTSEVYSTIRRRKSERGKNYNPMDPMYQQTSFGKTPPTRHSRTIYLGENPDETSPKADFNPQTPQNQPLTQESPI
ncbi:unnamed protein product [Hydatigera taeniaeformis]|uniref:ANK_REP_REGION domain-containing protein n=1 Tax=Hydatigena taeniaeformis TaxID=6205 RepID=A0A0R3WZS4_HYDTA|nr:unnamed protein product [Hydatigera taeniaeformis]